MRPPAPRSAPGPGPITTIGGRRCSATLVVAGKPASSPGPVAKLEPAPLRLRPSRRFSGSRPSGPSQSGPSQSCRPNRSRRLRKSQRPRSRPAIQPSALAAADQTAPHVAASPAPPPRRRKHGRPRRNGARPEARTTAATAARLAAGAGADRKSAPSSLRPSAGGAEEKAKTFIASFDGGACFLHRAASPERRDP